MEPNLLKWIVIVAGIQLVFGITSFAGYISSVGWMSTSSFDKSEASCKGASKNDLS